MCHHSGALNLLLGCMYLSLLHNNIKTKSICTGENTLRQVFIQYRKIEVTMSIHFFPTSNNHLKLYLCPND